MPLKKSELYSSIWKSCDELRGGMDASQYKDYVLVLLFVKYVSDRYAGRKNAELEVPVGGRFADMVALKADAEIGDNINKIIGRLAEATDLKGVIDIADFNDPDKLGKGKEMVERLSNLIAIFNKPELDFRANRAEGDDLLGDAYEYLMRHFATESGKSKGQFYTPAEVSRVIAKVIDLSSARSSAQTIHDPTCGSGSLLLKAHDEAKARTGHDLTLYGQEMDNATRALARMNMILHECPTADIWQDNTLARPYFREKNGKLKTFDFVVANPPFSSKAWNTGFDPENDEHKRFALGVPPDKNGDYAFLLHVLTVLKPTGKGAVILPHGVLFRGNTEARIRKEIVCRGYVKGLIGLPPNLFYGTNIPACIVVLDKEHAAGRRGIFMIDASRDFLKDGNKNRLRARDIHRIVDAFTSQREVPGYARMVPVAEIEAKEYNLSLPRYIDSTEPDDFQDIDAHLRGGIPERDIKALASFWQVFSGLRAALFADDRPGYVRLQIAVRDIKAATFNQPEFAAFHRKVSALFTRWKKTSLPRLTSIAAGDKPKELIEALSEGVLETFEQVRLIDAYAVYQHLMDHWTETMQDDVYLIVSEGWQSAAKLRLIPEEKNKKIKVKPDLTVGPLKYRAELVPPSLVVARHFVKEQGAIEALEADTLALAQLIEDLVEEHGDDDGILAEARDVRGILDKSSVTVRLEHIETDPESEEERKLLERYLDLVAAEAAAGKKVREAQKTLAEAVVAKYGELNEEEIKTLVIEDKWLASLASAVRGELDRVSQGLIGRIRQLAERYSSPLAQLTAEVAALSDRVDGHLATVQQLLTGQRRLPGFGGKWETKRVDEMGDVWAGKALNAHGLGRLRPYLRTKNVLDGRIVLDDVLEMPFTDAEFERFSVKDGDVLLNEGQSIELVGRCSMYRGELSSPCAMQNQLLRFRARPHTCPAFAEHLFRHCQQTGIFSAIATQTTSVAHLGSVRFKSLRLRWPPLKAEQRAIAAILSDMDAEITGIEARRDKILALKQGMMQELLTGRTRLV